jgi:hypothetical protein
MRADGHWREKMRIKNLALLLGSQAGLRLA